MCQFARPLACVRPATVDTVRVVVVVAAVIYIYGIAAPRSAAVVLLAQHHAVRIVLEAKCQFT
jgi:hypothetical protein